ncbi:MAG: sigma 54-interacting transcriptional regulator, partial [Syntrophobacteria bacterium]
VLEEKEFFPVGASQPRQTDVRVIAATNQPLEKLCETGQFRQDLYFRLATIAVYIPPLRERQEDILLLTNYFLETFNKKYGKNFRRVSREAADILINHPWKGNVRELKNAIERVVLLEDAVEVEAKHLDFLAPAPVPSAQANDEKEQWDLLPTRIPASGICLDEIIRHIIGTAYRQTSKNQMQTAKLLGITRNTLLYRLKKYGIR